MHQVVSPRVLFDKGCSRVVKSRGVTKPHLPA
jgi:hypothetical protein